MKLSEIAAARLSSQQIASAKFKKVKDLVAYMGALQSQDYAMSKWAIGLRLPGSTETQIEKALDKGEIIRTHVLRPTWHIIAATDIYWMLALSADKIKALMKTMDKQLGLTEKIFIKSNILIEKAMRDCNHLTREELTDVLQKAKIPTQGNRLAHLLERAELDGIACSGKMNGNKKTYALLSERVPNKKEFSKEESLALLAKKYFTAHGPATVEDFSWWSGLTLTKARLGLEMVKSNFIAEKINEQTYWFSNDLHLPVKHTPSVHLLPAYDEFIISYKDRTAALDAEYHKKVLTVNGIFNPAIILNGRVAGLWKRSFQNGGVHIETVFFQSTGKTIHSLVEKEANNFGQFVNMKTSVSHSTYQSSS
ncbi:MAG: winged helix DNA-binding domain-containing protein [Chitinophagaceae bacterium]